MSKSFNPDDVAKELCSVQPMNSDLLKPFFVGIPKGEMGVIMSQPDEPKTKYNPKLQKILEYCQDRKKGFDNPMFYQDDEYYIQCNAKSDVLEDVINFIQSINREGDKTHE